MKLNIYVDNLHCGNCEKYVFEILSRRFEWANEPFAGDEYSKLSDKNNRYFKNQSFGDSRHQKLGLANALSIDRESGLVSVTLCQYYTTEKGDESNEKSTIPSFIRKDFECAGFKVTSIDFSSDEVVPDKPLRASFPPSKRYRFFSALDSLQFSERRRYRKHAQYCKECDPGEKRRHTNSDLAETATANDIRYRAVFAIGGMTCSNCAGIVESSITQALNSSPLDFEAAVSVSTVSNTATVVIPNKQLVQLIIESVNDTGYTAQLLEVLPLTTQRRYKLVAAIEGITCAACASAITSAVEQLPYIDEVAVNVLSKSATFILSSVEGNALRDLQEVVEDCGFEFRALSEPETVDHAFAEKPTRSVNLRIDGMFCLKCPERVNEVLSHFGSAELIIQDPISLQTPFIKFKYIPNVEKGITIRSIIDTILEKLSSGNDSNIKISIVKERTLEEHLREMALRETQKIAIRLVASLIFAIPTFVFGVVGPSLLSKHHKFRMWLEEPIWAGNTSRMTWVLFILSTPVYFFVDDVFHRKAFLELRALWKQKNDWKRRLFKFGSMNLLVCLGTTVAYFASIAMLAISATNTSNKGSTGYTTTYFDAVVFLTFFLLVGRLLETFSKNRTAQAVNDLSLLKQREATLVDRIDGKGFSNDRTVHIDYLEIGDYIKIAPGESPPIDCIIAEGQAGFDESALTGESIPIEHKVGEQVFAGTVNVGTQAIIGKLCALNGDSLLDQIVNSVRDGQLKKAPVEKLADSLTSFFVPLIVLIAIITWIIWISLGFSGRLPPHYLDIDVGGWTVWSLEFATSVFVVACPCGIGLAAPTALFVGGGLAAKHGILARGGGAAFQDGSKVSMVCFDKTGTLTLGGKPKVTNFAVHSNPAIKKIAVQAVRDLELASKHPIATGLKNFISQEFGDLLGSVTIQTVEEIAGKGLKGDFIVADDFASASKQSVKPQSAILGNETFMAENNCHLSSSQIRTLADWKAEGKSVVVVAIKCGSFFKSEAYFPVMLLAVRDEVRPEAKGVINMLQREGIECWMISGDNRLTATAIAKELGIDNVVAEVLPEEKANKVTWIKETHLVNKKSPVVAFVGDGINDGPALAAADVGIALATGSDLAMSACDFALLSSTNTLCSLLTLLQLSRKVFRRVKFNFAWALVYNMIGIPIAAGVIYPYKNSRLSPVWASAAMAASSVSVVMSSLALRMYRPPSVVTDKSQKIDFERLAPVEERFQ
ncbi:LAME_0C05226g1_1 [Lachancea meyersii CBS 8951]|uniref:LAME_0C05226g1_1 n=1 Tax=Lachancea meyersii CBS 8951 TaxID=1266667 RepID=A0A1G4J1J3_9SACH|nr:LAME_0C05226g1_1 [Lachancea meyersii CBS 8951]